MCEAYSPAFASSCVKAAASSDSFCADVPGSILAASAWMKERCESSRSPRACYKILQPAVVRCIEEADES
jgi:hypothetical protein